MGERSLVGYVRVSPVDEDPTLQQQALVKAGCGRVWIDHASCAQRDRPQWRQLLSQLRPGHTVVVWKLDRCARSVSHLVMTIEGLHRRGVGIRSLSEPIDTTGSAGRWLTHVIGALAEFERDVIRERIQVGTATGRGPGRPLVMTPERLTEARRMVDEGLTKAAVARILGVPRSTLYRAFTNADEPI